MKRSTAYPFLYPDAFTIPNEEEEEEEPNDEDKFRPRYSMLYFDYQTMRKKRSPTKNTTRPPGKGLYKITRSSKDECALVEELQDFSKSLLQLSTQAQQDEQIVWPKLIGDGTTRVPFVFSTKELALLLHLLSLRNKAETCQILLKEVEEKQNGTVNPHWNTANTAIEEYNKSSNKLLAHNALSLSSKVALATGALIGLFGGWKNNDSAVMSGVSTCLLGLGTLLVERLRYKSFDEKEVEEALLTAATHAETLLNVKEPFTNTSTNKTLSNGRGLR